MPGPITTMHALDAELRGFGFRPERPANEPSLCPLDVRCPSCGRCTVSYRSYVAPFARVGPYDHRGLAVCDACNAAWLLA
jgi:hypothetical protein